MTNTNPNSSRDDPRPEGPASKTNFFTVFVDKHVYGLDVKEAETIFKVGHITPIPLIHREVVGFINLRGKIVVAVSLRRRLGIPETDEICEKFAIGLEAANEHFALLVDRVGDVSSAARIRANRDPAAFHQQAIPVHARSLPLRIRNSLPSSTSARLFDFSI